MTHTDATKPSAIGREPTSGAVATFDAVPQEDAHGLRGLRILVTGAASGIGKASASYLAQQGASVLGLDIQPGGPDVLRADLCDPDSVNEVIAAAAGRLGGLDGVVCSAGQDLVGSIETVDDAGWDSLWNTNVMGVVRTIRAALPHLLQSPHASVVIVSSALAHSGSPNRAAYTATKGALTAMSRALAAELAPQGVRVNSVSPGTTATPLITQVADNAGRLKQIADHQPLGRVFEPGEVAAMIGLLIGRGIGPLTGSDLLVDGGLTTFRARPQVPS